MLQMKIFKSGSAVVIMILIILNILYAIALKYDIFNRFSADQKVTTSYQIPVKSDSVSVVRYSHYD